MMTFREARETDLPVILALLADDALGSAREGEDIAPYRAVFKALSVDPHHILAVADEAGTVVGTMQISFIAGLSRPAALRGQIESVRIARSHRGEGVGTAFFDWAIAECRARGCRLVQLTSDRTREGAARFYEKRGFVPSHIGFKMEI